jgi:hypothetical protein
MSNRDRASGGGPSPAPPSPDVAARGDASLDRAGRHDADELEPASRDPDAELPVVARLVVEIRSDGSRTVARGAIEDATSGQRVAIEARGDSPLSLALQLARSLASVPRLSARAAVRGLLGRRRDK